SDQKLYKFLEGDFLRLHLNDIEDILLLVVQNKLFNLKGDIIFDLVVALRMYTRMIVIQKRVEDLQLDVAELPVRLLERRIMRSLEKFFGGRDYGADYRLLQRTI
ncbi:hypothetical protein Tco_1526664, partial [Tanacetum coccineum]